VHRHKLTRRRNVTACHLPSMDGSCFVTLYECMCMHTCAHIPVCTYVYIYVTVSLKQWRKSYVRISRAQSCLCWHFSKLLIFLCVWHWDLNSGPHAC
jgi:hypothetical protein